MESGITIRTYDRLEQYAKCFSDGTFRLLVVRGTPGTGKTETFTRAMGNARYGYLKGKLTPFGLYREAHTYRDRHLLIDDADTLFASLDCRRLLKSLCESTSPRPVSWKSKAVENEGLPTSFDTSSPVAVLANQWKDRDPDMQAVSDRGHLVSFEPSVEHVHERVAQLNYLGDREVYDFIGRHLQYVTTPTMRTYVKAGELRRSDMPGWQDDVLEMIGVPQQPQHLVVLRRILADRAHTTNAARVRAYCQLTGRSQASFYRDIQKIA